MLLRRLLLTLIASAAACSQSGLRDGGEDAGHDGGHDAGSDAGRDAGARDAAPEAGADASADGGGEWYPEDPGWVPLGGLPEECGIERAEHPERIYPPSVWEPCPEQPVGCSRAPIRGIPTDIGWHDDATGRGYVRTYGLGMAIVDLDRGVIAAWREAPHIDGDRWLCAVRTVGIGDGYGAAYVIYRHFVYPERNVDHVYHAPLDEIRAASEPIGVITGLSSTPQHLSVTRTHVFAEMQPVAVVLAFTAGRWGPVWSEFVDGAIPQNVRGVGDFAFWEAYAGAPRIAYGSLDRPAGWLRDARPDRIRGFETDGVDLAWVEIRDSPPSLDLWTAPVVFDAAELRARRVGAVEGVQYTGVGGGWFVLMKGDPERLELIELATGRRKTWLAPPGYTITATSGRPNYVTATEIVFDASGYWVRLDPRSVPWDE